MPLPSSLHAQVWILLTSHASRSIHRRKEIEEWSLQAPFIFVHVLCTGKKG